VTTVVDGTCTDAFLPLRDLLERNLSVGEDAGAALAVVHDGELVADVWGGEARPGVPWTRDTMVQVWSVSKTMVALTALTLVERGVLDLDARVADSWPAWGAHGKGGVLLRQLLGHTSGVPGWTDQVSVEDILDLEGAEALLAEQEPWYEPGSAPAYQIICHGHLVDAVVRGATGRPLADVLHEEIVEPLGGGFRLGVPDDELDLVADLIPPAGSSIDFVALGRDHFLLRTVPNPLLTADVCNSSQWRRGGVGGMGGHGTARGIAQAQAVLSHGGAYAGLGLLTPETIARVFEVQAEGIDQVLAVPVRFGIGYGLPMPAAAAIPDRRICWWTGYGGAIVVNDLDTRTTFAYTPNRMVEHMVASARTDEYVRTTLACLEAV
jgi:CubicO group peptidase (beta-lactamase class C family)